VEFLTADHRESQRGAGCTDEAHEIQLETKPLAEALARAQTNERLGHDRRVSLVPSVEPHRRERFDVDFFCGA